MKLRTVLVAILIVGCVSAAPAGAAEVANHPFLPARTISAANLGKQEPPYFYEDLCGAAVDPAGDIFLSDYFHHKIEIWPAAGGHLEFGVAGTNAPCAIAVDSENTVYLNYWHEGVVRVPAPYESVEPVFTGNATGLAIDPLTDDLYVDEGTSIARYASPVEFGNVATRFGQGSLVEGFGVAFSYFPATAGQVYAADAASGTVKVYEAASPSTPVREIDGAGTPQRGFVSLFDASLATDQTNGHLYVVDNIQPGFEHPAAVVDEFTATGAYRGQLPHALIDAEPSGIAVNESASARRGEVYVTSGNGTSIVYPPHQDLGNEQSFLYGFGPAGAGRALTVTKSGIGFGTVTSAPAGINCGTACEAEFNSGATVTLTATPAAGSVFSGWSGACSGSGACQLTMTSGQAVSAEFSPAPTSVVHGGGPGGEPAAVTAPSAAAATPPDAVATPKARCRRRVAAGRACRRPAGKIAPHRQHRHRDRRSGG